MADARVLDLLSSLADRLSGIEAHLGIAPAAGGAKAAAAPAAGGGGGGSAGSSRTVAIWDADVAPLVGTFVSAADAIGGPVSQLGGFISAGFGACRSFIAMASETKKPTKVKVLQSLAAPIAEVMKNASDFCDNRAEHANERKAVAEALQALNWLLLDGAPAPLIESYQGGTEMWSNKVRMKHRKGKPDFDPARMAVVDALKELMIALHAYVLAQHTTGLVWNPAGREADGAVAPAPAAAAAAAAPAASESKEAAGPAKAALFAEISSIDQSSGRTAGLRHVTKDMKSKAAKEAAPAPAPKPRAAPKKKVSKRLRGPPTKNKRGNKLMVEYWTGDDVLELEEGLSTSTEIYLYRCADATVRVTAKVKAITLDDCEKVRIIFEGAISTLEFNRCERCQAQVVQRVPAIAIDQSDGVLVFLSEESMSAVITTSKSSEMNVQAMVGGDIVEMPIPEQFCSTLVAGDDGKFRLVTEVSELYS